MNTIQLTDEQCREGGAVSMVTVKVDELEGAALDWAVTSTRYSAQEIVLCLPNTRGHEIRTKVGTQLVSHAPSVNWFQGGPLIEEHHINIVSDAFDGVWEAYVGDLRPSKLDNEWGDGRGRSPLIAAMRAIVRHQCGPTVQIPAELMEADK